MALQTQVRGGDVPGVPAVLAQAGGPATIPSLVLLPSLPVPSPLWEEPSQAGVGGLGRGSCLALRASLQPCLSGETPRVSDTWTWALESSERSPASGPGKRGPGSWSVAEPGLTPRPPASRWHPLNLHKVPAVVGAWPPPHRECGQRCL